MPMPVMQVVDEPHMLRLMLLAQILSDGDHILRLATPAAVVIET